MTIEMCYVFQMKNYCSRTLEDLCFSANPWEKMEEYVVNFQGFLLHSVNYSRADTAYEFCKDDRCALTFNTGLYADRHLIHVCCVICEETIVLWRSSLGEQPSASTKQALLLVGERMKELWNDKQFQEQQ